MTDSQNKRLLIYLQKGNKVTPLNAWENLGIYRLSARVFDLRYLGYNINMKRIEVKNKLGETFNVAEYSII